MTAVNILTIILASAGLICMAVSLIGIIRFPDFFTRLHAQGVGDTLGVLLLVLAMMVSVGFKLLSLKYFSVYL